MMDVVVDDQDALQLVDIQGVLGGQGHVVEEAIPIELGLHGMVTRRPDDGHAIVGLSSNQMVHQLDGGAGGQQRKLESGLRGERWGGLSVIRGYYNLLSANKAPRILSKTE